MLNCNKALQCGRCITHLAMKEYEKLCNALKKYEPTRKEGPSGGPYVLLALWPCYPPLVREAPGNKDAFLTPDESILLWYWIALIAHLFRTNERISKYILTIKFDTNVYPNIFISKKLIRTNVQLNIRGKGISGATVRSIGYQLDSQWDLSHPTFTCLW